MKKIFILVVAMLFVDAFANPLPERVKGFEVEKRSWRTVGPGGGGWIQSMLWSRHDRDRFFVGCDVGGFYYSENAGRSYVMRNRGLENMYVETMAEHPKNPDVLFLGTRGGIFKTTNRGLTWLPKRAGFPKVQGSSFSIQVSKIIFHPNNPDTLFLTVGQPRELRGGRGEVWRSDDCGETWRMIVKSGLCKDVNIFDLSINPLMPAQMIIATDKGLFRSEDGGGNWSASNDGLPSHLRTRHLARSASHPSIMYVTLRQKGGEKQWSAGVYRSEDNGRTWQIRSGGLQQRAGKPGCGDNLCTWTDCIAVDSKNPDVVWTGGAAWWYTGILKSTDGGKSWKDLVGAQRPGWITFWGHSVECMALSPLDDNRLSYGTSGMVVTTENGGATWKQRYSEERNDGKIAGNGLEVTCLHAIKPSVHRPGRFYLGYFDIGLLITEDNGRTMTRKTKGLPSKINGNCFSIAEAPDDVNVVWAGFGSWGGSGSGCVAKSCDGGETWQPCTNVASGWVDAAARDLTVIGTKPNYRVVYAGNKGLIESCDGGKTWKSGEIAQFPQATRVRSLASDGGKLYAFAAGVDGDAPGVFVRAATGGDWTRISPMNWVMGDIRKISVEGERILVTARSWWDAKKRTMYPGGAWLSIDAGKTWKRVLDDKFCSPALIVNGELYVGLCDHPYHDRCVGGSVVHSCDDGKTWKVLDGNELQNWNPSALAVDPLNPRKLWIGSGGNSIFVSE